MEMLTAYASAHRHPFIIAVHLVGLFGLRDDLFREVQRRIAELRHEQAA